MRTPSSKALTEGIYDVPSGKMPSIITYLEMTERPAPRLLPPRDDLLLRHVPMPSLDWYRRLFRAVGEPWIWLSRLRMSNAELAAIIHDPLVDVHVLERDGAEIGILELDRRIAGEVELGFFGLVPQAVSTGGGRWLMERALDLAWRPGTGRFWVHTCTLDHPAALAFYRRTGFRVYAQKVEIDADPRLSGLLPRDAAPHAPILP